MAFSNLNYLLIDSFADGHALVGRYQNMGEHEE